MSETGNNEALLAWLDQRHKTPAQGVLEHDGIKIPVVITNDGKVTPLANLVDPLRTRPMRRKGTAVFADQSSFEEHAMRYKTAASTLWADPREGGKLVSVLNYHQPGSEGTPEFGDHRGEYRFPLSDEWKAWTGNSGKVLSQLAFAEFIEERLIDVVKPENAGGDMLARLEELELALAMPSQLLKLSRGMKVHVASEIASDNNLSSGEGEIQFKVEHRDAAGGKLRVPGAFIIHVPVFRGGENVSVAVFLRYRVDQKVTWTYQLYRATQTFDEAFQHECEQAKARTDIPLFFGSPES